MIEFKIKQCNICGRTFEVNNSGRPRKYCSDKCRKQAELQKQKKQRVIVKKCEYCGKSFNGNKKQKYCSQECYEKAHQDKMNKRNSYRWYHDIEYRKQKVLKHGEGVGTITLAEDKEDGWEKELIRIRALKKEAGINKR